RRFAARYGVLTHELDTRLIGLIGTFVVETAHGESIKVSHAWLKGQLAGDPNAANLEFDSDYPPHISAVCRKLLEDQVALQHRIPEGCYVSRDVQQLIRDQLLLYPVVFVYGDGGCGKSLAVVQYLRSVCHKQFVWSEHAGTATETGIVAAINRERSPGY